MEKLVVHLTLFDVTKNKVHYRQDREEDPMVTDLYINKEAVTGPTPEAIVVTIERE